jgi:hypothetical protein
MMIKLFGRNKYDFHLLAASFASKIASKLSQFIAFGQQLITRLALTKDTGSIASQVPADKDSLAFRYGGRKPTH